MQKAGGTDGSQGLEENKESALHAPHHIPQTLVVVGTETALFDRGSKVRSRILSSLAGFDEVRIIVLCGRGFSEEHREGRIHIYPTNSRSRLLRIFDAVRIGRTFSQADIVTAQDPFESGLAAVFIARRLEAGLHIQVHTDFLSPAFSSLSLSNRLRVAIAGFVLRRADHVRTVSERVRSSLRKAYKQKDVTVLPIFVDIPRFKNAEHNPALLDRFGKFSWKLLVVARLEREKNVMLALSAFAKSAPKDACLIVIGSGRERAVLEQSAKRLNISRRVFFESTQDVAPYYKLADIVLVPSHYEGYGMVIVEALSARKPVLSTDVGVAREAGALIAAKDTFSEVLADWFKSGPRHGELKGYPYDNFEGYIEAYRNDIAACNKAEKTQ